MWLQMDRQWMYNDRCSMACITGLNTFLDAAEANRSAKGFMCCPCRICKNGKEYSKRKTLHAHIYCEGFMDNYSLWTKHGEPGVVMGEGEEEDDILDWVHLHEANSAFEDDPMDEADENAADKLGRVLLDGQKESVTALEHKKFEKMLEDHKKVVVPKLQRGAQEIAYHT